MTNRDLDAVYRAIGHETLAPPTTDPSPDPGGERRTAMTAFPFTADVHMAGRWKPLPYDPDPVPVDPEALAVELGRLIGALVRARDAGLLRGSLKIDGDELVYQEWLCSYCGEEGIEPTEIAHDPEEACGIARAALLSIEADTDAGEEAEAGRREPV